MQEKIQGSVNYQVEDIIRTFKFFKQQTNPIIIRRLKYEEITVKTEYSRYKNVIDRLYKILTKYNINHQKYIKFCVLNLKINDLRDLYNFENIVRFTAFLKKKEEYLSIYRNFMKTIDFISDECINNNLSPLEYIKYMINDGRIGYEYISGRISKYFIVSICDFKKLFSTFDNITKDEFSIIYNIADELKESLYEAFRMFKGDELKIINLINKTIQNKKINKGT